MKLYVVGIGCGSRQGMTLEAQQAVMNSDVVVFFLTEKKRRMNSMRSR